MDVPLNLFEDIFNEKHTNNTNTERTGNTEADSEKRWEQLSDHIKSISWNLI